MHTRRAFASALPGVVTLLLACMLAGIAQAQFTPTANSSVTFTTLVDFDLTNGANPIGTATSLVQGLDGNLYGVANSGGTGVNCSFGVGQCGTFFRLTPSGTLTPIYDFCSQANCADGSSPLGLTLANDGNFYGVTEYQGTSNANCADTVTSGCGTLYRITPSGSLTTLYNWCSQPNCADGNYWAGVIGGPPIQATDGNFYGVTGEGGAGTGAFCSTGGCGTIFKVTAAGQLTTLYAFCSQSNCDGGALPLGLIQGADGNFYGTTSYGGTIGDGAIFKITPTGTFTPIHSFCESFPNCTDGAVPYAALTVGRDGNFYGTTSYYGANGLTAGTFFKITPQGALTTLYNFCSQSNCADGANPFGNLVLGTDGNFYGSTNSGGATGGGTIFKVTPAGVLTTLYSFDVFQPFDAQFSLVQATNGSFYGMTLAGGTTNPLCYGAGSTCGTVYKLDAGLGPFIETLPAYGKAQATVRILGSDLTGATSVDFNGVAAEFTVVSGSYIKATVPSGATSGYVTVTTPNGTLKSNVKFRTP